MTEDDTFNTLKKWTFEQLRTTLGVPKPITVNEVINIIIKAGWSQQEYIQAHRIYWDRLNK